MGTYHRQLEGDHLSAFATPGPAIKRVRTRMVRGHQREWVRPSPPLHSHSPSQEQGLVELMLWKTAGGHL